MVGRTYGQCTGVRFMEMGARGMRKLLESSVDDEAWILCWRGICEKAPRHQVGILNCLVKMDE